MIKIRVVRPEQEGKGMRKAVVLADDPSLCATLALKRWKRVSGLTTGPLFVTVIHGDHMRQSRLSLRFSGIEFRSLHKPFGHSKDLDILTS